MRDKIVRDKRYFDLFIKEKNELISKSLDMLCKNEIPYENKPLARNRIFIKSLEILVAKYSKGVAIESLTKDFSITLKYMAIGWEDNVVKFKKGRPTVIYNYYMLNHCCYMVWMLSFAILLNANRAEVEVLKRLVVNGGVTDDLILFLLSHLTNDELMSTTKIKSKPFAALSNKKDITKINSLDLEKYLKNWYKNCKLLTWHNYSKSIEISKYYFGYWSFESAAITAILDLNDSKLRESQYYPADLFDYYVNSTKCE